MTSPIIIIVETMYLSVALDTKGGGGQRTASANLKMYMKNIMISKFLNFPF